MRRPPMRRPPMRRPPTRRPHRRPEPAAARGRARLQRPRHPPCCLARAPGAPCRHTRLLLPLPLASPGSHPLREQQAAGQVPSGVHTIAPMGHALVGQLQPKAAGRAPLSPRGQSAGAAGAAAFRAFPLLLACFCGAPSPASVRSKEPQIVIAAVRDAPPRPRATLRARGSLLRPHGPFPPPPSRPRNQQPTPLRCIRLGLGPGLVCRHCLTTQARMPARAPRHPTSLPQPPNQLPPTSPRRVRRPATGAGLVKLWPPCFLNGARAHARAAPPSGTA
jgi:hypothetical protein